MRHVQEMTERYDIEKQACEDTIALFMEMSEELCKPAQITRTLEAMEKRMKYIEAENKIPHC